MRLPRPAGLDARRAGWTWPVAIEPIHCGSATGSAWAFKVVPPRSRVTNPYRIRRAGRCKRRTAPCILSHAGTSRGSFRSPRAVLLRSCHRRPSFRSETAVALLDEVHRDCHATGQKSPAETAGVGKLPRARWSGPPGAWQRMPSLLHNGAGRIRTVWRRSRRVPKPEAVVCHQAPFPHAPAPCVGLVSVP